MTTMLSRVLWLQKANKKSALSDLNKKGNWQKYIVARTQRAWPPQGGNQNSFGAGGRNRVALWK